MKTITIVGARPQFIKAAPVCAEFHSRGIHNILVHTGQHYDYLMSQVFFDQLNLAEPTYNLEIGSASAANQIGMMVIKLEEILEKESPDIVITYGDTNSTLAAALTAVKLGIPLAHVEGGERNFTREDIRIHPSVTPEETNRVLTDHISNFIYCASKGAVENLKKEGICENVFFVGDVMYDSFILMRPFAEQNSKILEVHGLSSQGFILATIHRPINTDDESRLGGIINALISIDQEIVIPLHPRTRISLDRIGMLKKLIENSKIHVLEPVGYLDMLMLESNAKAIVTDSGGVIREAFFAGVPSIIVDQTNAWKEIIHSGWATLAGADQSMITKALHSIHVPKIREPILGSGNARELIVSHLLSIKKLNRF